MTQTQIRDALDLVDDVAFTASHDDDGDTCPRISLVCDIEAARDDTGAPWTTARALRHLADSGMIATIDACDHGGPLPYAVQMLARPCYPDDRIRADRITADIRAGGA